MEYKINKPTYVIWGMGQRGKLLLNHMEKARVVAIIDISMAVGDKYENIPIISLEQYKKDYTDSVIIVTPYWAKQSIYDTLEVEGICSVVDFDVFFYKIYHFLWLPKIRLAEGIPKKTNVFICAKGCLTYDLFRFYNCMGYSTYVGELCDFELKKGDCVVSEDVLPNEIQKSFRNNGVIYKDINQLLIHCFDNSNIPTYSNLERYKQIHKGKRCFIVATGPSLRIEDLEKLCENGEICIGVNGVVKGYGNTQWRPNYYIFSDPLVMLLYAETAVMNETTIQCFVPDTVMIENMKKHINIYHLNPWVGESVGSPFSEDISKGVEAGYTVTYVALQLAVYMGIKEIYLLGVDCNYENGGKRNYFLSDNKKDIIDHQTDKMIMAYGLAEQYAKNHGIVIKNATRGGKLEVFQRVDFDSLL